ncbi:bifunctional precorrin-2 dehydrogenase/sirohydrochlorin ferrochelatase [Planctomycetota bacterium]
MAKYPLFLELKDRPVVVIGGGSIALQKAKALQVTGARLTIVAKEICACLEALCQQHSIPCHVAAYATHFIEEAVLVIAATDDRTVNEQVFSDCRERRILCNVVDVPDLCDFYVPAIVRRGALQIAIGTDGYSPAYAGQLRRKLETMITETHGEFVNNLRQMRQVVVNDLEESKRKDVLVKMACEESFTIFAEQGPQAWKQYAEQLIRGMAE